MNTNRIPTHPGDVIKEELEYRGITQKRFADLTGVPYTMLNEILNGKRPVTSDFALIVEAAIGISPQLLINMQARYNMAVAMNQSSFMTRLEHIRKSCAAIF
ncbi:MAG: HigA family addiction module antidote protein [Bacteroidales bacterium]|nr:HigA family addiction module antidote protein [Bacteroidales bacterium]